MSPGLLHLSPWVVLALPFAKILTTSLSIGSGGSGGLFGPGIVIGGFTGAAVWWLLHGVAPTAAAQPAPFVIVGMIACLGSIAHTPLAALLMVVEMTGSLTVLPPAMFAVGIASMIAGEASLYRSQLPTRVESAVVTTRPARLRMTRRPPRRRREDVRAYPPAPLHPVRLRDRMHVARPGERDQRSSVGRLRREGEVEEDERVGMPALRPAT